MYESFFSLTVKPFDLLPNPDFLFLSRSHKKALTYLDYAVRDRAGFILLTGEIGSGKTTLIRDLFNKHTQNTVLCRIVNTRVNFEHLLAMINDDFGLQVVNKDKQTLLRDLDNFLIEQHAHGKRAILIIDEAQSLTPETLEELRLLSNLETDSVKLLHIVLAGQPELRQTLALPELLQLRQRISCFCHILPLEQSEIGPYILHRLERAGNRQAADFSPASLEVIWRYSRGIPRLINIICDFLLLLAFADGERVMTPELVRAVITDLDFENCYWGSAAAPTTHQQESRTLPAEPDRETKEPIDETIKGMLSEILSRVDHLEKRDSRTQPLTTTATETRLDSMEQYVQSLIASTARLPDDIRNAPVSSVISAPSPAPASANIWEKIRGLFGFLFRAA